jgi:hypothetical protein
VVDASCLRTRARTLTSRLTSALITSDPTLPVPPVTRIRITKLLRVLFLNDCRFPQPLLRMDSRSLGNVQFLKRCGTTAWRFRFRCAECQMDGFPN